MCVKCAPWLLCYVTSPYQWHWFLEVIVITSQPSFLMFLEERKLNTSVEEMFVEITMKLTTKMEVKSRDVTLWKLKTTFMRRYKMGYCTGYFHVLAVFQDVNVAKAGNIGYKWCVQSMHFIVMDCCRLIGLSSVTSLLLIHYVLRLCVRKNLRNDMKIWSWWDDTRQLKRTVLSAFILLIEKQMWHNIVFHVTLNVWFDLQTSFKCTNMHYVLSKADGVVLSYMKNTRSQLII